MRTVQRRWVRLLAVGLLLGLVPATAHAYTWKWVDDEGQTHVTDNFPSIPDAYKPKAVALDEEGARKAPAAASSPVAPIEARPAPAGPAGSATPPRSEGARLRMTGEGGIEEVTEPPAANPAAPGAVRLEGASTERGEKEKDKCGYDERHWTLRVVPAYQDLERAEAEAKRLNEDLKKSFGSKPHQKVELRNDKQWADKKLAEAKKMIETTIPEDAKKCETPTAWLKPPVR